MSWLLKGLNFLKKPGFSVLNSNKLSGTQVKTREMRNTQSDKVSGQGAASAERSRSL